MIKRISPALLGPLGQVVGCHDLKQRQLVFKRRLHITLSEQHIHQIKLGLGDGKSPSQALRLRVGQKRFGGHGIPR